MMPMLYARRRHERRANTVEVDRAALLAAPISAEHFCRRSEKAFQPICRALQNRDGLIFAESIEAAGGI